MDARKQPQEFLYRSEEVGACSAERQDFLLINMLGFLKVTLCSTPESHKEKLAKCLAPFLSGFLLSFVFFFFSLLHLLLKRMGLFRKTDTTNIKKINIFNN